MMRIFLEDTKPKKQFLSQKSQKEEEQSVRRAYELAKQSEIAKQKNQEFWSHIQLLKNK